MGLDQPIGAATTTCRRRSGFGTAVSSLETLVQGQCFQYQMHLIPMLAVRVESQHTAHLAGTPTPGGRQSLAAQLRGFLGHPLEFVRIESGRHQLLVSLTGTRHQLSAHPAGPSLVLKIPDIDTRGLVGMRPIQSDGDATADGRIVAGNPGKFKDLQSRKGDEAAAGVMMVLLLLLGATEALCWLGMVGSASTAGRIAAVVVTGKTAAQRGAATDIVATAAAAHAGILQELRWC